MKRDGFTLAELLLVIAILAVLAALLLPVFTTARHASKASMCASNLRQLSKATLLYTQDHDECFPLAFSRLTGANGVLPTHSMGCVASLPARLSRCAMPRRPTADRPDRLPHGSGRRVSFVCGRANPSVPDA